MTIRIAIVGLGKIARDEHLPAIAANPDYDLVAVVSTSGGEVAGVPCYRDIAALVGAMPGGVDAVAICTPPVPRHAIALQAMAAGMAVLLEKPPAATLGEIDDLAAAARRHGVAILAAWHSQYAAGVAAAADALAGRQLARLTIRWHEDVRKWHPGQEWIWAAGGFGVFDPGINALSIATRILDEPLLVRSAALQVPDNRQSPIAARMLFAGDGRSADFDWRGSDAEEWTIAVDTDDGRRVELTGGGAHLSVDGHPVAVPESREYPGIYRHFADVVRDRSIAIDREPLRIVADAFLIGERTRVEPFV